MNTSDRTTVAESIPFGHKQLIIMVAKLQQEVSYRMKPLAIEAGVTQHLFNGLYTPLASAFCYNTSCHT